MEILQCENCLEYTLKKEHCSAATVAPKPPKFSVQDKYEDLRRKAKEPERIKKGLL